VDCQQDLLLIFSREASKNGSTYGIDYSDDIKKAERKFLLRIVNENSPSINQDPAPLLVLEGLGDSSLIYSALELGLKTKTIEV